MAMSPRYLQYLYAQNDLLSRIVDFNVAYKAKLAQNEALNDYDPIPGSVESLYPKLAEFRKTHGITFDFELEIDRFCLIRNDELDVLSLYLGACIVSIQLDSLKTLYEQDEAINAIGRGAFEFALKYGYLIQNFNFKLHLSALAQDCTYLGLCALKRLSPLFSNATLSSYFEDRLVNYTIARGLNPDIVKAQSHVLNWESDEYIPAYSPQAEKKEFDSVYPSSIPMPQKAQEAHREIQAAQEANATQESVEDGKDMQETPAQASNSTTHLQDTYNRGIEKGAFTLQQGRFLRASVHRQKLGLNQDGTPTTLYAMRAMAESNSYGAREPQVRPKHNETLVTLDFSPTQVQHLSIMILTEAINPYWRDYLTAGVNFTRDMNAEL